MQSVRNVLIVGAGMAGMTLGVALKRAGIACEIVEIRPNLTEPGTGISLQGPALRALQSVGVMDRCIERGFGYSHFKTCDAAGNVTGTVDLPRLLGPDYPATVGTLRQSVHEVLAGELTRLGVPIRLGATVTELQQENDGVDATFSDGHRARYDLIVGADGQNSKIREMLFGTQHVPRYTGQMNWRATVSRPPEAAAYPCGVPKIQSRAAPIPRTGSSCVDKVCRVPNDTSFSTVARSLAWSTWASRARSSASGTCAVGGGGSAGGLTSA